MMIKTDNICRLREKGGTSKSVDVCVVHDLELLRYMFFVVRSNDSFNFPLGLIKYVVTLIVRLFVPAAITTGSPCLKSSVVQWKAWGYNILVTACNVYNQVSKTNGIKSFK